MSSPSEEYALYSPTARFGGCWGGSADSKIECTEVCDDPDKPFFSGIQLGEHCGAANIPAQKCEGSVIDACVMGGCPKPKDTVEGGDETVDSSTCNLIKDTETDIATLYGACQDKSGGNVNGCFWSEEDCHPQNERWLIPEDLLHVLANETELKPYCDCSDVRIGACRTSVNNQLVCAVDAKQCSGPGEHFVTARLLMEFPGSFGNVDCRLCHTRSVESGEDATEEFVAEAAAVLVESKGGLTVSPSDGERRGNRAVVGWTFGVLIFFIIYIIGVYAWMRRRNSAEMSESAGKELNYHDDDEYDQNNDDDEDEDDDDDDESVTEIMVPGNPPIAGKTIV